MYEDGLRDFILKWNNLYPVDYIFRKKYSIPFNSKEHRDINLVDLRFDIEEDFLYRSVNSEKDSEDSYVPATGNFIKKRKKYIKMNKKEQDQFFDSIKIGEIIPPSK